MMDRYSRQFILPQIGAEGQKKIASARVAIVGVGALGSVSAQLLARAGVGLIRLIDRDGVEWNNLQRQVLYTEKDAREGCAKASAAKKQLELINSEIKIEAIVDDLHAGNISQTLEGIDTLLDGTDNFETRYLLNDYALKNRIPYIYAGAIETRGMVYSVLPDNRPCLRCLFPEKPSAEEMQTCDLTGVLSSTSHTSASLQFTHFVQARVQDWKKIPEELVSFNIWNGDFKKINASELAVERCSGCSDHVFPYLETTAGIQTLKLCGRNAVQIQGSFENRSSWSHLEERWKDRADVLVGVDFAKVKLSEYELTLFKNGRVIVKGTEDPAVAKSIYARWVGC